MTDQYPTAADLEAIPPRTNELEYLRWREKHLEQIIRALTIESAGYRDALQGQGITVHVRTDIESGVTTITATVGERPYAVPAGPNAALSSDYWQLRSAVEGALIVLKERARGTMGSGNVSTPAPE